MVNRHIIRFTDKQVAACLFSLIPRNPAQDSQSVRPVKALSTVAKMKNVEQAGRAFQKPGNRAALEARISPNKQSHLCSFLNSGKSRVCLLFGVGLILKNSYQAG